MTASNRQLVHMPKPYLCKWIDGQIVIVRLPDMAHVATIHDSTLFRQFLGTRDAALGPIQRKVAMMNANPTLGIKS